MFLQSDGQLIGMTIKHGGLDYVILNIDRDRDVVIVQASDGVTEELDYVDQILEKSEWYDV